LWWEILTALTVLDFTACSSMKLLIITAATVGLIALCAVWSSAAEPNKKRPTLNVARQRAPATADMKLVATRKMLIERKRASREHLRNSLSLYEELLQTQTADYELKKELYQWDLISKAELENSERAMSNTRLEIEQIRQWIAEDDVALLLTEEAAQEELARLPPLPLGGYDETTTLIRYNGPANWSLAGVQKVATFYRARFGRALPISAMGQSATHDRMGLDHREALDIAVQPGSAEGRELMAYLRRTGIPFIAFRGKVPSMSTGAHIHIGRPSPRIIEVKHRSPHPATQNKIAEHG
jgi:hypothetical protein